MKLQVSERDKKLILVLLIVLILGGAFLLFDKITTSNTELEQQYRTLSDKHSDLSVKNGKRNIFVKDTEKNKEEYKQVLNSYNTSLSEEQTLVFLGMVEQNTGVWLKQMGFTTITPVYTFGQITSTNPSTPGQKVYSSDYEGISTQLGLSYECTYSDFKKVLEYLRENGRKATVNNISFSYSQSTDIVSGTMQMTLYAVTGSDREVTDVNIKDIPVGTDNIFASDSFITSGAENSYKDRIINDHDLYIILNQPGSDMDNMSVGQSGDPSNTTAVSSNNNGVEDITIRVTGQAGDYRVSYKIGTNVYPADDYDNGAPLVCGDSLDLLIISKPRAAANDNTLANVTIINESDMVLNAAIINDDAASPRVNITQTIGNVVFYTE